MKSPYEIIVRPIITERAMIMAEKPEQPQYVFKVATSSNKIEIARAIEAIYKVKVASVNTVAVMGKAKRMGRHAGRRSDWKKAFVVLAPGQKIDVL